MVYSKMKQYRNVYHLNGIWKFKTVGDDFIYETELQDFQFIRFYVLMLLKKVLRC